MKYTKPVFIMEEFQANVAVAACNWQDTGATETKFEKQYITCAQSGMTNEEIFNQGLSCQHIPCHLVYVATGGTYTEAQLIEMGLSNIIQNGGGNNGGGNRPGNNNSSGGGITVPEGGGYVMCWGEGEHYGNAPAEVVKIMTSSY